MEHLLRWKSLKKIPIISLYWFTARQKTGTLQCQKWSLFESKFSVESNGFVPSIRNSKWRTNIKNQGAFNNFAKFTVKYLCRTLFFCPFWSSCRYVGLEVFQKGLHHRCFSIKIVKFYRKSFSQNTAVRLFLMSFNFFNESLALSPTNQHSHSKLSRTFRKEKCLLQRYLKSSGKNKVNGNILRLRLTWQTKGYFAEAVTRKCLAKKVL